MGLGVVSIKTAGTFSSVDLLGVPKPQDLADKISSQMDEFKKDEQMQLARSIAKGMKESSQA